MSRKAVEIKDLCITSGNRYLLQNINWEIEEDENWVLFGENGCGKTTLLSTIAGFNKYHRGSLKVFDQEYTNDNILELRKQIGWVSSSFFDKYYHSEKAIDIVLSGLFGSLSKRFSVTNQDILKAQKLMATFHLKNKMERPFDTMSKGERQNVLLARAIMSDPKMLILDEPGSGLDVFARENMLKIVEEIAKEKESTVIYVTHYPEEILPLFTKCVLMKNGSFYTQGEIDEVFTSERVSDFVDSKVAVKKIDNKFFMLGE